MATLILQIVLAVLGILAVLIPVWISRSKQKDQAASEADKQQSEQAKKDQATSDAVAQDAKTTNQSIDAQKSAADELAKKWTDQTKG